MIEIPVVLRALLQIIKDDNLYQGLFYDKKLADLALTLGHG